jgi:hypothetical protein
MKQNIFKTLTVLGMFLFAMGAWADPTVTIKKQLNGVENNDAGTATSSISNGKCTLTVTPPNGYYVTSEFISAFSAVTGNMAHGRTRAPGLDTDLITVTCTTPDATPSGETKYEFEMPTDGSNVEVTVNFQSRKTLTLAMVSDIEAQTYTSAALTPAVTVTDGNVLTKDTHYTVAYSNNTNAGNTAKATITGLGIYAATPVEKNFTINPKSIATATVGAVTTQTYTYTGSAITPNATVSIMLTEGAAAAEPLIAGTDYTITGYANNTDAATADSENAPTITITGTGNFTGTATGKFTIGQADFDDVEIGAIDPQPYTGFQIKPDVTVTFNGNAVAEENYTIGYGENINPGENAGSVTLTSTNKNFSTATRTVTFKIIPPAPALSPDPAGSPFYEGQQVTITANAALGNATIKYILGNDLNVATSTYTAPLTLTEDTKVTAWVEVTVGGNPCSSETVTGDYTVKPQETGYLYVMDGTALLSTLRVTNGNTFNVKDHYQLVYPEDIPATDLTWYSKDDAVASVTDGVITAVGYGKAEINFAYAGNDKYKAEGYPIYVDVAPKTPTISLPAGAYPSNQVAITITKENVNGMAISYTWDDITGNNNATWKNYTDDGVAFQEGALSARVGYTYTKEGVTSTVYSDTVSVTYTYLADIATCTVTGNGNQTYNGSAYTPELTVTPAGGGTALVLGTDYTISYKKGDAAVESMIDASEYMIVITAKDGSAYGGSKEVPFTIIPKKIITNWVSLTQETYEYTGNEIQPEVKVKDSDRNVDLTLDTDFTVAYSNNVAVGTATATVTGTGNYTDMATVTFTINASMSLDDIFASGQTYATYCNTSATTYKVPDGIKTYIVTGVSDNKVTLAETKVLPPNSAILLEKGENVTAFTFTAATDTDGNLPSGNLLKFAANAVSTSNNTYYVLYKDEFLKATGNIPAGKCYLDLSGIAAARAYYGISHGDGNNTGIKDVKLDESQDGKWYDLQGRCIDKPTKPGLYIRNGEKIVVNNNNE